MNAHRMTGPHSTYAALARSLASAKDGPRRLITSVAAESDGRTAAAVFCARWCLAPEDAAAEIGCTVAELNEMVRTFSGQLLEAMRARRKELAS